MDEGLQAHCGVGSREVRAGRSLPLLAHHQRSDVARLWGI